MPTPPVPLGLAPSFGFGDRIGLATLGHVRAMQKAGGEIEPIFPQQSIREMARTNRSASGVMRDAMHWVEEAGWKGRVGADADHLKTPADVELTAKAGFTFFTIDPSDHVDEKSDTYDADRLDDEFDRVKEQVNWFDHYVGSTVDLPNGTTISFDEEACKRCAVKYGRALNNALALAVHIRETTGRLNREHEIELSVDETDQPTTLAEHYIVADQCLVRGMNLVSLAPRFIGELEKGVDYKGDVAALESSLEDHAAIAEALGPYKLSLHSGSDKLSMYAALARATKGRFHVKTAGTSYLEALRVVLRHDEPLFRRIVTFGRERYETDKATYHVSATVEGVPPENAINDVDELERLYLEHWRDVPAGKGFTEPGRQILHCTFGSTLTHEEFGPAIHRLLKDNPETYAEVLEEHFVRHLEALREGM